MTRGEPGFRQGGPLLKGAGLTDHQSHPDATLDPYPFATGYCRAKSRCRTPSARSTIGSVIRSRSAIEPDTVAPANVAWTSGISIVPSARPYLTDGRKDQIDTTALPALRKER